MTSLIQGIPDPSTFSVFDTLGPTAVVAVMWAVTLYLLYRAEKRGDDLEQKLEDNLKEQIRDFKEKDKTLELIAERTRGD